MQYIQFSEDHIDALTEFMNIASGQVTSSIAELLDTVGTMHIPKVTFCTLHEMYDIIDANIDQKQKQYVSKQLFYGTISGECLFVLSEESAISLNKELYNLEDITDSDIIDGVSELSNIIGSTMLSRLAEELGTPIRFSAPVTNVMSPHDIYTKDEKVSYNQVIIISTHLDFLNNSIDGFIYILTENEMIASLKSLIDKRLEELL